MRICVEDNNLYIQKLNFNIKIKRCTNFYFIFSYFRIIIHLKQIDFIFLSILKAALKPNNLSHNYILLISPNLREICNLKKL